MPQTGPQPENSAKIIQVKAGLCTGPQTGSFQFLIPIKHLVDFPFSINSSLFDPNMLTCKAMIVLCLKRSCLSINLPTQRRNGNIKYSKNSDKSH